MSQAGSLAQRHADAFASHGWPTQKLEDWRYVPLKGLNSLPEAKPTMAALGGEDIAALAPPLSSIRAVFVDGEYRDDLSFIPADAGLTIESVAADDAALFGAEYLTPDVAPAAAAIAGAKYVVVIRVTAETVLESPLELVQVVTAATPAAHGAIAIDIQPGARLDVVEQIVAAGESSGLANQLCRIRLQAASELRWYRLQQLGDAGHLITRIDADVEGNARFDYCGVDLGGHIVRHDIACALRGRGAQCHLDGVYALSGKRLVDNHTRVDHISPDAVSREFFKGVLDGQSRGVFNGKVVVHAGADGTDSKQTNRNLLLSATAEVDTKPELEIYADDVKCAHGATVGQLDERQLFYLRSRGIGAERARKMLIDAFCLEVVDRIANEAVAKRFHNAIDATQQERHGEHQ